VTNHKTFRSFDEAIQFLADLTGKTIKIAADEPSDLLPGGFAESKTVQDIADKHGVSVEEIEKQLTMGIKVEMEHTNDSNIAKEISLDHLWEIKDYYDRLKKMEEEAGIEHE